MQSAPANVLALYGAEGICLAKKLKLVERADLVAAFTKRVEYEGVEPRDKGIRFSLQASPQGKLLCAGSEHVVVIAIVEADGKRISEQFPEVLEVKSVLGDRTIDLSALQEIPNERQEPDRILLHLVEQILMQQAEVRVERSHGEDDVTLIVEYDEEIFGVDICDDDRKHLFKKRKY